MKRVGPALALAGFVAALFFLERRRPLRRRVDPGPRRIARNLAMAATTAIVIAAVERPLVGPLARRVERERLGLLARWAPRGGAFDALALALLDYTLYLWHVLLHRVPWLWRLHLAHHVDLDLDASTALRFHFAEFLASVPWRMAQVRLIGVGPRALALWQKLAAAEIVFHHSNLLLPEPLGRALSRLVMTPRLHGIHHSTVRGERESNYSSGLAVWDVLHGTRCTGIPQEAIVIGVERWDEPGEVTLGKSLALPFTPAAREQARDQLSRPGRGGGGRGGWRQLSQRPQRSKPAPSPK